MNHLVVLLLLDKPRVPFICWQGRIALLGLKKGLEGGGRDLQKRHQQRTPINVVSTRRQLAAENLELGG